MCPRVVRVQLAGGFDVHHRLSVLLGHRIGPSKRTMGPHVGWVELYCLASEIQCLLLTVA